MNKLKSIILSLLTSTIGNLLVVLRPKKVEELKRTGLTLATTDKLSFSERLMRGAILIKAEKARNYRDLEQLHINYWEEKGAEFFADTEASFESDFLTDCAFIFDLLKDELKKSPETFDTLVEIGTGNGKVLNYLREKFPNIKEFVGIDLSKEQIEINAKTYAKHESMHFLAIDGFDWVKANGKGNTIFVTSRGVLEYFTEKRLGEFFKAVNGLGKVFFVAIEPNGSNHNFNDNPNSVIYGYERSFSHNYPKLFKDAGFKLWHHSTIKGNEDYFIQTFVGAVN